ncbi:hypothetical protein [Sphaerothrix gracilis]|uniref:hypothetical protein n=1 Tax=Sphaerothrix gracilis TaxID=3151835 RepID=UPI0031FC5531
MTRWQRSYWKIIGGSAIATKAPLTLTAAALAHGGSHGEDAEATSPVTASEHHTPTPETAASKEMPESSNAEGGVMPTTDIPMKADETTIEVSPATQGSPVAVSRANVTEEFSVGLGEALLGFIIAGPFLLLSLKKKLQS